jgi:hypothetical protein
MSLHEIKGMVRPGLLLDIWRQIGVWLGGKSRPRSNALHLEEMSGSQLQDIGFCDGRQTRHGLPHKTAFDAARDAMLRRPL